LQFGIILPNSDCTYLYCGQLLLSRLTAFVFIFWAETTFAVLGINYNLVKVAPEVKNNILRFIIAYMLLGSSFFIVLNHSLNKNRSFAGK